MSIEKVKERIIESAKAKAEQIVSEEEKRLEPLMQSFLENARSEFKTNVDKSFLEIDRELKRKVEFETLGIERAILLEKTKILDSLFDSVLNRLLNVHSDKYYDFLCNLIKRDAINDGCEIFMNEKDFNRFSKKLSEFVKKEFGKSITIAGTFANIKGGCIIKGKEVEFDDSFETIVQEIRDSSEIRISQSLFKVNK
jgi:V/A-type H+-transporting ATPase subunit E